MMNELVFNTLDAAFAVAKILLENGSYVVMLSREDQFWIVNYEYSELNNRNDVVFMSREEFDEKCVEASE